MNDVGSVKKEGNNAFHNYKYATAADISHKIQPLLAREGLVIFQTETERHFVADGAALAITYEFQLAHTEGETWPDRPKQTGMAAARNSKGGFDDKAANKCHTAARKYFMLALFQIPTGDYDDADAQEDRPEAKTVTNITKRENPHKTTAEDISDARPRYGANGERKDWIDTRGRDVQRRPTSKPETRAFSEKLLLEMHSIEDANDLEGWSEQEDVRDRVASLPESWEAKYQDKYQEHLDALRKQKAA
jgi:hypothetical protein